MFSKIKYLPKFSIWKRTSLFKSKNMDNVKKVMENNPKVSSKTFYAPIVLGSIGIGCSYYVYLINKNHEKWQNFVKIRIQMTYSYLSCSTLINALTAFLIVANSRLKNRIIKPGAMNSVSRISLVVLTGFLTYIIPYESNLKPLKLALWTLHSAALGLFLTPIVMLKNEGFKKAAFYSMITIFGYGFASYFVNYDQSLYYVGTFGIIATVLGSRQLEEHLFTPASRVKQLSHAANVYVVVAAITMCLIFDTSRIIRNARNSQDNRMSLPVSFDPINNYLGFYFVGIDMMVNLLSNLISLAKNQMTG